MWTPNEVRKLVALIAGILFMVIGIILIVAQIQATGNVDITSSVINGKLQSGSAGLFICFFSLLIILSSIFFTKSNNQATADNNAQEVKSNAEKAKVAKISFIHSKLFRMGIITFIAWIGFLISLLPIFIKSSFVIDPATSAINGYLVLPVFICIFFPIPTSVYFFYCYLNNAKKQ